jgi:hypothetical protein
MTISVTGGLGGVYTLIDLAKMLDPNQGRLVFCAATLSRRNPFVREFPIMEANQILTHVGNRDASLPTVQKRALNDGVPKSAHKEVPISAPMSLFETMNQIDEEILRLAGGNAEGVRQRKDARFIEAMGQSVMDECFYGSLADDVLGFNGLAVIFNVSTNYPNGDSTWYYNVQLAGGSGSDTTSIWAIEPGPEKVHLIYPKGTQAGIEINDLGKQLVTGITSATQFVAYVTQFKWRCGIFVQDERCVQRIANIETSGSSNIFDDDLLIAALNRLPTMGEDPATRIYVNRTIRTQMDIRVKDKTNVNYASVADAFGKPVLTFRGVPVQVCDGILNTETAIS